MPATFAEFPSWARRTVTGVENIPMTELKAAIRADVEELPVLLEKNDAVTLRFRLLELVTKCEHLLVGMHFTAPRPPAIQPEQLRLQLIAEIADLPKVLENGGVNERNHKVHRVSVLARRVFALLMLGAVVGICFYECCVFSVQTPIPEPFEYATAENPLAG